MTDLYIGLMSGTSLDGVDAVLASFSAAGPAPVQLLAHVQAPLPPSLREELLALNIPGFNELHRAALASNGLSRVYASATADLLRAAQISGNAIRAIGAHGQTVRHRPGEFDSTGYTLQLLNGPLLAELTGIDVVCDFRSRDVAADGQGAPLVPGFHAALFDRSGLAQAILNLGGIANLTLLDGLGGISGFDCGPGNALMDSWCLRHTDTPFDNKGQWAASGQIIPALLAGFLAEPFLARRPPKSTGRDLFNETWLQTAIDDTQSAHAAPADIQATLAEFTAQSVATALRDHLPSAKRLLVCGGGAFNWHLMQRLAALLPAQPVCGTDSVGLPVMQVEAAAFAWLCQAFISRKPGNCPEVTGSKGPRLLGGHYPAR